MIIYIEDLTNNQIDGHSFLNIKCGPRREEVAGVSVLSAEYLIVFKVKAFLDLRQKKADGHHVNERNLKKHKNDVFRLFAIVDPTKRIALPEKVQTEMRQFLQSVTDEPVKLRDLGLDGFELDDVLNSIRAIYEVREQVHGMA